MNVDIYQIGAMRTANPECKDLANACLGLAGEVGEFVEIVKKHLYHGIQADHDKLVKELGDVAWYMALACEILDVNMSEVLTKNLDKLEKRYPEKFVKGGGIRE